MLIGANLAGRFFTGNMKRFSSASIMGIETSFGWTISGKLPVQRNKTSTSMIVTTMFVNNMNDSDLWRLDLIGIEDPTERKTSDERQCEVKRYFLDTVTVNEEGRYQVNLPWKEQHPPLPTNHEIATKRLDKTCKRLQADECLAEYQQVFDEWSA